MQDFDYNYIKNKYGDKAETLLTDTDGLRYKIETENFYDELYQDKELFDFSNYQKGSKYYSGANSLVVSKMKDKTSGLPIKDFVGLKSKMYTSWQKTILNLKKQNKDVVDGGLKYEYYKNILLN